MYEKENKDKFYQQDMKIKIILSLYLQRIFWYPKNLCCTFNIQSNLPIVATQGKQKSGHYWQVAVIHRVFNTVIIFSGGILNGPHEVGDRYWQVAGKTGLTVDVADVIQDYMNIQHD